MRFRRRVRDDPHSDETLQQASASLAEAQAAHKEQRDKRKEETESVIARLKSLAGEDSNHLGMMVLEALTEGSRRNGT